MLVDVELRHQGKSAEEIADWLQARDFGPATGQMERSDALEHASWYHENVLSGSRLQQGVYSHVVEHFIEKPEVLAGVFGEYGVADNLDQILEKHRDVVEGPVPHIITLMLVRKKDEPKEGGWRWHKWGEYIGTKTPQHEYIADEGDDIQEVWCYHIHRMRESEDGLTRDEFKAVIAGELGLRTLDPDNIAWALCRADGRGWKPGEGNTVVHDDGRSITLPDEIIRWREDNRLWRYESTDALLEKLGEVVGGFLYDALHAS